MRRHVLAAGIAASVLVLAGVSDAGSDVNFKDKSKVEKAIAELVCGEIAPGATQEREAVFNAIDKVLEKDTKGVALKAPGFWVDAMQAGFFSSAKGHKTETSDLKKINEEKMEVQYADDSKAEVPIWFRGCNAYQSKNAHTLVVTILPKGTDAKAWLTENWEGVETAKNNWILAAVVESDKLPIADQPFLVAHAFGTLMFKFNTNPNRWYLEGVGEACTAAQRAASSGLPDRIAGLILRNPTKAVTNANSKLFSTYVLHEGDTSDVAKVYTDLDAERNVAAKAGDGAVDALAAWIDGHAGRTLPTSYDFETATTEQRILIPWTGSLLLNSPAKRGDPIKLKLTYDKEAGKVDLTGENLGEFEVYMNDDLLDLDRPVTITCNGQVLAEKTFERSMRLIIDTADEFGDYGRAYTAKFRGFAPTTVAPADEKKPDDGAGGGAGQEGQ